MTMERAGADWFRNDRIISIQAITVRLPLKRPVSFSTRRLEAREFVIVRIRTADGIEGVGYTYGGRLVANAVDYHLADLLVGKPAGEIQGHWQTMYQEILLIGRRGAGIRALSAVDLALWDILGKRTGLPLYRLLGGYRDTVPAYFSGGYYRDGMTLDDVAAEAERAVATGFTSVKIKVGARPSEDLERMRVTREVIGPERLLALDANNAWRSAAEALPHIRRLEAYDPWWIEEPLSPDDIDGHARLARDLLTPVATGEIEATRWGFHQLLMASAADILQPDACVLGGITEWLRVANEAAAHGIPVAPHWNADVHVHLAAATPNCLAVEYFDINEDVYNFDLVLKERLAPEAGYIPVPSRPGIGLEINDAALNKFEVR